MTIALKEKGQKSYFLLVSQLRTIILFFQFFQEMKCSDGGGGGVECLDYFNPDDPPVPHLLGCILSPEL